MKKTTLLAAAFAAFIGLPTMAQTNQVIINGALIDWYYYGRDYTGSTSGEGWHQQPTGLGTASNPYNYGLISMGVEPGAADGKTVWVNDFPIRNHLLYGNAGGVFTGDAYYSFFMHEADPFSNMEGEYGSEEWEILVRKWDLTTKTYKQVGRLQYQPTDLTYDPVNDKVYGMFYVANGDETGYKLGELDMETFKVRLISREAMQITSEFRAIAINSQGVIYGIDASGNVATISTTDGAIEWIGNTGFKSQRRMMSATFDFRTDKLYYIAYMNDGKLYPGVSDGTNNTKSVADGGRDTGIYEIDTTTGVATLIGSTDSEPSYDIVNGKPVLTWYGKMEITGIYVEGAFTRPEVDQNIRIASFPSQLVAGETGTLTVTVKNCGLKAVEEDDWTVNFYADNQLIGTKSGRDLEKGESRDVKLNFTAPAKAGKLTLYAEVVNAKDQEARNNKTELATVYIVSPVTLPTVALAGRASGNGITLNWTNPNGHIVEGAENFAPFTYEGLSDWTLYDGDEGLTQRAGSYNAAVDYANWNTPKAYIVFNPEESGIYRTGSAEKFRPYSGNQYFASWYAAKPDSEGNGQYVDNNDWLISPLLNGTSQTITFMARGYKGSEATGYATEMNNIERLCVLYSTVDGDVDLVDFSMIGDTIIVDNEQWTKYSVDLPEGAQRFALQCVSKAGENYVLMIDDIEFYGKPREVLSYKVYRNGELVTTLDASTTTYSNSRTRSSDVYTVTAVYGQGESAPSNALSLDIINGTVGIDAAPATVADNTKPVFYDLSGRVLTHQPKTGVYIVRQGNKTRKVVVR